MSGRRSLFPIFVAGILFAPTVLLAQEDGSSGRSRKVAPKIAAEKAIPAPRLPAPAPTPSPAPLAVTIVGNPVDETGHLIINDHQHGPNLVEVVNPQRSHEFSGFTSVETLPNIGVFGMTRLCAAEIPGSRMCTLEEALSTSDPPASAAYVPAGWVRDEAVSRQPVLAKTPAEPIPDPGTLPPTAPQNNQCLGWSSVEGWATTLSSEGGIGVRSCAERIPVACCRPKL